MFTTIMIVRIEKKIGNVFLNASAFKSKNYLMENHFILFCMMTHNLLNNIFLNCNCTLLAYLPYQWFCVPTGPSRRWKRTNDAKYYK